MPRALLSEEEIERRKQAIYQRSHDEAVNATVDDYIEDEAGTMWIAGGSRGQAKQYYAAEEGCDFTEVRCRRVWMAVDLFAIADAADWMARDPEVDADTALAYTWDGQGWLWQACDRDHRNAIELWECTRVVEGVRHGG